MSDIIVDVLDPYGLKELTFPVIPCDPRPLVLCEQCAQELVERNCAFSRDTIKVSPSETISVKSKERAPRTVLKPDGEPCPRCGDNSPPGTFPPPPYGHWLRLGEHGVYHYLYTGPDGSWYGNAAAYADLCERIKAARQEAA